MDTDFAETCERHGAKKLLTTSWPEQHNATTINLSQFPAVRTMHVRAKCEAQE